MEHNDGSCQAPPFLSPRAGGERNGIQDGSDGCKDEGLGSRQCSTPLQFGGSLEALQQLGSWLDQELLHVAGSMDWM